VSSENKREKIKRAIPTIRSIKDSRGNAKEISTPDAI
jgi:hypothetical protein